MKITLMLFLVCLLKQVYSSKMEDLKASGDMAVKRHVNYSTNDGDEVISPSHIDTMNRVKRHLGISKRNNGLAARLFDWYFSNTVSTDINSPHGNNYGPIKSESAPDKPGNNYDSTKPESAPHKSEGRHLAKPESAPLKSERRHLAKPESAPHKPVRRHLTKPESAPLKPVRRHLAKPESAPHKPKRRHLTKPESAPLKPERRHLAKSRRSWFRNI